MSKSTTKQRYSGFVTLVESVAHELYSKSEWEEAEADPCFLLKTDMLTNVYDTAFTRNPKAFDNIQWINDDNGMPAWVRPGVEWSPDLD